MKKKRQHERQQKRAAVKKEKHEKALKEIELSSKMSTEEANEALADIDLVIDLEEIEQIEVEISNGD